MSADASTKDDVTDAFAALEPVLIGVSRAIKNAPLNNDDKAGLAAMATAYLMGTACGALQAASPELQDQPIGKVAEAVAKVLVDIVKRGDVKRMN